MIYCTFQPVDPILSIELKFEVTQSITCLSWKMIKKNINLWTSNLQTSKLYCNRNLNNASDKDQPHDYDQWLSKIVHDWHRYRWSNLNENSSDTNCSTVLQYSGKPRDREHDSCVELLPRTSAKRTLITEAGIWQDLDCEIPVQIKEAGRQCTKRGFL